MPNRFRAYLDLSLAMSIVGSSVVAGKLIAVHLPLYQASTLRFALAALVMVPLLKNREGGLPRLSPRSWLVALLQAVCGVFLFSVCLLNGLTMTDAASAGIITSTTPAWIGALSFLFLGEAASRRRLAGIALAVAGVASIQLGQLAAPASGVPGSSPLLGNLLVLGAALGEALFTILGKSLRDPVSPLALATLMTLFGLALFLPLGVAEAAMIGVPLPDARGWIVIAYSGLVVTVAAYLLWFRGVKDVPASQAAVFTGLMSVSSLTLSWLVLGETIAPAHLAGCACVLAGIGTIAREGEETAGA